MGTLEVNVVKATKLPNIEKFGKSDPYVSLNYKDDRQKTKYIDDNLDPEWNESFLFKIAAPPTPADRLEIRVLDKENLVPDRLLGTVDIDGRTITKASTLTNLTLTLTDPKGQLLQSTLELKIKFNAIAGASNNAGGGSASTGADATNASSSSSNTVAPVGGGGAPTSPALPPLNSDGSAAVPSGGGDGGADGDEGLAGVKLRQRNIQYSTKEQDFQIRVKVVEARQIHGANIDPVCKVVCFDQTKQTRIIKSSNSPQWNQIFYYNVKTSAAEMVDKMISFSVYNSQMLRHDALIGSFKFDCGLAYEAENHALINRWLLLSDPEDAMAGPKGYLKISVIILGPGDEAVSMKGTTAEDEDIEANLLRPAGVNLRPACYDIKIYAAEELPRMDAGILNKLNPFSKNTSAEYVDPYVMINFAGKKLKTKVLEGTDHPNWNEVLHLNVMFPSMCDKLKATVYDWDRSNKNDPIGSFIMNLDQLCQTRDDEYGYLPTFGPCFINLYGSTREYSDLPDAFEDLNLGKAPGVAYRGRVLMELTTRFVDEHKEEKSDPIGNDDLLRVQKYLRKRHFVLHATFMNANMVSKCDGPVQFEMSIGNHGNILEENVSPAASTTPPTNSVFDGKFYYFLPWGGDKPTICVESSLEDISVRLYTLNQLLNYQSFLEDSVDALRMGIGLKIDLQELEENAIDFTEKFIVLLNQPLPHWDDFPNSNPMNDLDSKLYKVRRVTLDQIKQTFSKLQKEGKNVHQFIEEFDRALNKIKSIAFEPQNSMPDVVIWMLDGKKRIACARIPAHKLLFAEQLQHRGTECGTVQTIILQKPYTSNKQQEDNWEIPAQLRIQMWLGLEKQEEEYHAIPCEGKLQVLAETYENQTKALGWNKGGIDTPEWSDHTGKRKLPKEAFTVPEGWAWDGPWYVAPELSLSFRVDTGLTEYTVDVYYHESRTPAASWTKSDPAYTDLSGNPMKSLEETKCPDGWIWDGEWEVDFNRPVDEDGWEYCVNLEMQGWVAVEKLYHLVRRKRYLRKRKLMQSKDAATADNVAQSMLARKQHFWSKKPKEKMKTGTDEGWEYALTFSSQFHEKERKLDNARRRRWHRKLKTLSDDIDPCMVMTVGDGDKGKAENMVVPRLFHKFAEPHKWQLRAYIYQARDLLGADSSGLSDPYCRLVFEYCSEKTIQLEKTLCPTWDQTLIFNSVDIFGDVDQIQEHPPPVVMELFDFNKLTSDEFLGRVKTQPKVLTDPENKKQARLDWLPIKKGSRNAGEILCAFELFLIPTVELPLPPPRIGDKLMVPHGIRPEMQYTRLEILCWGVRNMRKYQLSSVNNPSVEFDIGEKFVQSDVLKNAKYNSNFVSNKLVIDVLLPKQSRFMPPLNIRVIDHRLFGRKPVVGMCSLSELASFSVQPLAVDLDPLLAFPILRTEDPALSLHLAEAPSSPNLSTSDRESFNGESQLLQDGVTNRAADQVTEAAHEQEIDSIRKKKNFLDLSQLDEDIDWWSKFYASLGETTKCAKYAEMGYDTLTHYDKELEKIEPFKGFQDLCSTFKLTRGKSLDDDDESFAGEFKGTFFVYPISDNPNAPKPLRYLDQIVPEMKKLDCIVRVYIVRAIDLQPNDPSGLADPYISISCGDKKQDSSKDYVPNQLNPEFGRMFQFKAAIPRDKDLVIKVMDYDFMTRDDVIGQTEIDLEDRMLSKYRATCGLPKSYCISGPCQWRDQQLPTEILASFCKRNRISEPFYENDSPVYKSPICRVGARTFVLNKIEKGIGPNPHYGEAKERLALHVLNSLTLVKEHVECRTLYSSLQPDLSQGKLEMWVDIFPIELGEPGPPFEISCRKPKMFELRVIIWNTTEVILEEVSITGEKMSDIYVKSWISGIDERQSTDVHYRSLDGDGNFNWRFIFPFDYIPAENKVVVKRKESIFSLDETEIRLNPVLIVQVWDNDKFSADDFLGTLELNLSELVTPAKNAKKCTVEMVDVKNKNRKMMNLFECKRAYGFWPFVNDETGEAVLTGKVEMELELVSNAESQLRPAGRGRDEPNDNPHLDPPKRPETSFFWLTSPWKTFKFIIWKRFKKLFIILLVVILLGLLIALFVYSIPGLVARKVIGV